MPTSGARRTAAIIAWLVMAAGAAADVTQNPVAQAREAFNLSHPGARLWMDGDRVTAVYGEAFSGGKDAETAAAAFVAAHSDMFGVPAHDLVPVSLLEDARRTQPLMWEPDLNRYKFTQVYYTQHKAGYPVYMADLRLLVRNEPGSPVVLAGSALRDLRAFDIPADIEKRAIGDAEAYAAADRLFAPGTFATHTPTTLVVWAGIDSMVVQPALCRQFVAAGVDPSAPGYQRYLFLVDVLTGQVVYKESQVHQLDVNGQVRAQATADARAAVCSGLQTLPLPYARVGIAGSWVFADSNGAYNVPSGAGSVTVDSGVRGRWFRVYNAAAGTNIDATVLSSPATSPGLMDFTHNTGGTEVTTAEVNAYIGANKVRDYLLGFNPSYPTIATQQEFRVNVQVSGTCNAFYDGSSINFYPAGGGCNNTAFGTVVYHEYGHHMVNRAGSGQGQYGEGYGDTIGLAMIDDPVTGVGFSSCSSGIRSANNTIQYPCSGEIHSCGRLLSGSFWSIRNRLVAAGISNYRDLIGSWVVNSVLLHQGTEITPLINIQLLTLDDNDGNIFNGTPRATQINAGLQEHSMLAAPFTFQYTPGLPGLVSPSGGSLSNVAVSSYRLSPQPGTGTLSYRVGNGSFTSVAMNQVSTNNYAITLPAMPCGQTVSYYLSVTATNGQVATDPPGAPSQVYTASIGVPAARFFDTFNTDAGWTVTNTPAASGTFDGAWERATPSGGGVRWDPATDADGSGWCYVTRNQAPNENADLDNGTTVLTSPLINASGGSGIVVSYSRFNNGNGTDDPFVAEQSLDGGANWTVLESTLAQSDQWVAKSFVIPGSSSQFRLRFTTSDLGTQTVVESGVDAVRVEALTCPPACVADFDGSGSVNPADIAAFVNAWLTDLSNGTTAADFDANGTVSPADIAAFVNAWLADLNNGC